MTQPVISEDAFIPLSGDKSADTHVSKKMERNKLRDDFRKYEISVMFCTQLSYVPVASTMLCTTFFEPSKDFCIESWKTNASFPSQLGEFYSLLLKWDLACKDSFVVTFLSVALMTGALIGAFAAGWLADFYGRKPVLNGSLLAIIVGNILISLFGSMSIYATAIIFLCLGIACGGYMVVNLVLLVETLELPTSRLLAVSSNGWSISMVAVALTASSTKNYYTYHFVVAITALIAFSACSIFILESCRWLDSAQKSDRAYTNALKIAEKNDYNVHPEWSWWEILRFSNSAAHSQEDSSTTYNYLDLFRSSKIYVPLAALAYCFIATSIVSFGFYFFLDVLPGNRYANMSIMGLSKFVMGWIPFLVSPWIGRRPVVLYSVLAATVAAWISLITFFFELGSDHWSQAALSLIVSASLDPTWKILHLYSTELFPTAVRNMARAVCNIGARLGSVIAPTIVHLKAFQPVAPIEVFTFLLTVQLVIVALFLPETKDKPLPSDFPSTMANGSQKTEDQTSV